jgi:hypothetical protein
MELVPKVQAFDDILSKHHRPPDFDLFEKLGDAIFTFGCHYYARDILPGEPEEKLKDQLHRLISYDCHAWICRQVRIEGTTRSMTQFLEDKGLLKEGTAESVSDYLECYLAMLFHQSPEICMTTIKHLVTVGLQHESQKATMALNSCPSNTSSTVAGLISTCPTTSPSPNPTPPPPLSKTQQRKTERLVSLRHQRAQAFIKFVYTELLFKNLIASYRPHACRTVFNAFLHYFSTQMYKTVYPNMIQATKDVNYTKPDKIRNENLDRLLNRESSWIGLAADIQSCPEVQKCLLSADLIIVNVARLHDNGVVFKCGKGGEKWTLIFKSDPSCKVKEFAKPSGLYEWLQVDQEVEELIASRVAAPVPARENDGQSGDNTARQNPRRSRGKRKRKGREYDNPGKDGDGKCTVNNRTKRRHERRPKR